MKIALNVKYFSPRGGGQTYLAYLAKGLVDAGHEVDVYALERSDAYPCSRFHRVNTGLLPKAFRDYAFAAASYRLLRDADYDVIFGEQKAYYLDAVRPGGGVWGRYMEREIESLAGHPVRILARRLSIKERLNRLLERRLYSSERLKHVIVNSRSTRDELLRRYGLPADRVHVIYNGVDVDRYNPDRRASMRHIARRELDLAEDDYVILFLARNLRLKGLMQLLQTMAQLKPEPGRPGPRLLAVGNKHFAAYAGAAEALGIRRSVRFMGPMGEPDRLYAAADVLAHPTFHDPCANVCLEAMATGLPVVTTRANGACELIDDGQSGFVIDSATNVEALTERLGRLTDVDLRGSMGIAAREAVKNLTPGSNLALVMEVFKAVVEEKNRTS